MSFWTPSNLNQMVGNANSMDLLRAILASKEKAPRAYMFEGPHGCGKNTFAKLFAKEMMPEGLIKIVDPEKFSSTMGQEDVGDYACIIFDNADRMTREQADVIAAKMDKASFKPTVIFLSSIASKVEQSIRARTLRVSCGKLSTSELAGLLSSVCATHKLMFDIESLNRIALNAQGIPSQALLILQGVAAFGAITMDNVDKLETGLECEVEQLLHQISNDQDPWELATKLKDQYSLEAIIDSLFECYAKAFLEGDSLASGKLSNYKVVGEILLKWKSAQTPPSSALFILVRELLDSNEVVSVVKDPKAVSKAAVTERDRGMTGTELDEFIMSGGV